MSVNVRVWGPEEALRMLGETGRDCNVVVFHRDDGEEDELYSEIMNWVGDNNVDCVVLPEIQRLDIRRLMLVFVAVAGWPSQVHKTNNGYMLLKMTYGGHARIASWNDDGWIKCEFNPPR